MQLAVDKYYPAVRRTPDMVDIDTSQNQISLAGNPTVHEYLLEFDPTSALPAHFTLIYDVGGVPQVRLSYRLLTASSPGTYTPTGRAHVFFHMLNSTPPTSGGSVTYSTSGFPAAAPTTFVANDASRVLAFALCPTNVTSSNASLLQQYTAFGNVTGSTGSAQRIDVYHSTDHKNFGTVGVPGNTLPQASPAVGTWVAIAFDPITIPEISVGGSVNDYTFIFNDLGPKPFVPFDVTAPYAPPTFKPLVQDTTYPWFRERPFATNSTDAVAGALPLLNASGEVDASLFEDVPPTVPATATETLAAGQPVNLFDNAGTPSVRLADNTLDRPASGYVLVDVAIGVIADVYLDGVNTAMSLLGLGIATEYFLGAAGAYTTTQTSTSGDFVQRLGRTTTPDVLVWEADEYPVYVV